MFSQTQQFYPTSGTLAREMYYAAIEHFPSYERKRTLTFFDPNGGKGDLLDAVCSGDRSDTKHRCYTCEIDPDLRFVLQGKGYRYLDSDFLESTIQNRFDVVLMNPPFNRAIDHILKAWQNVADGGVLIALLNSANFTNPTAKIQELNQLIERFGEKKDKGKAFREADRPANVDVTMITLKKPSSDSYDFTGHFSFDRVEAESYVERGIQSSNKVTALVARYKAAETVLIERYRLQQQLDGLMSGIASPIRDDDALRALRRYDGHGQSEDDCLRNTVDINAQIKALRSRFWATVLKDMDILKSATSKFKEDFKTFQIQQSNLEFSEQNILQLFLLFISTKAEVMNNAIIQCFDTLTKYHAGNTESSQGGGNYSGWKHNLCWKINGKKIIIPRVTSYEKKTYEFYTSIDWKISASLETSNLLKDLDKVCRWLRPDTPDDALSLYDAVSDYISRPSEHQQGKWFKSYFFEMQVFKGTGTLHLRFLDPYLLDDINMAAAQAYGDRLGNGVGVQ